jgi:UDP-N-acetylmuramate: L-alanyl-gamma-D-glutamyl-meso-diaminopimelate ligase
LADATRIYLIGVCGTAMATLAALLKQRGTTCWGPISPYIRRMSDFLAQEGIKAFSGYDAAHITSDIDLVIDGNAISRGES